MKIDMKTYTTILSNEDIELLDKIRKYLAHKANLPNLGYYRELSDEEIWSRIVIQFCVMGGTRNIDNVVKDISKYSEFRKEIGLNRLLSLNRKNRLNYIETILRKSKATRFPSRQAKKLDEILDNPEIIQSGRIVVLVNLSHTQPYNEVRAKLMEKNPHFRLKSASDFMIDVGLSHDVIALDTRVGNILKKHFNLNMDINKVQGNLKVYTSIEQALRQACEKINITLAQLDRMLFKFSGKDAISFIAEDL